MLCSQSFSSECILESQCREVKSIVFIDTINLTNENISHRKCTCYKILNIYESHAKYNLEHNWVRFGNRYVLIS